MQYLHIIISAGGVSKYIEMKQIYLLEKPKSNLCCVQHRFPNGYARKDIPGHDTHFVNRITVQQIRKLALTF